MRILRNETDEFMDKLGDASRIGIMGGTFDPIHYGHLAMAEAARVRLLLDAVLFIPVGNPVFKQEQAVTDKELRYEMACLATASNPYFVVSRVELDRGGVTYTIDTVNELQRRFGPKTKFFFIVGADAFAQVFQWRDTKNLFKSLTFAVADRPGANRKQLQDAVKAARSQYKAKLKAVKGPSMDISSSAIRAISAKGGSIRYLTPEPVIGFIQDKGLYRSAANSDEILRKLRATQSEKRFAHTVSVAEEAKRLARLHGVSESKAYLAGILHDGAKGLTDGKLLDYAKRFRIGLDDVTAKRVSLLHAAIGAELAKRDYGVTDEDVLNAIRFHTTGRPGMSRLEKVIFVADYIDPTRVRFNGLEKVRACAEVDLDAAVILILQSKIAYNRDRPLHPLSKEALDYAEYHYEFTPDGKEDV